MQLRYENCTPYVIVLFITIITRVISMMEIMCDRSHNFDRLSKVLLVVEGNKGIELRD